jgi:hypothetical protein
MRQTIGIDLAADGKKTSVCTIEWENGGKALVKFPQPAKHAEVSRQRHSSASHG